MPSIVLSTVFSLVFLRNIYSKKRFIGTPPNEVPYLDVGIAKYIFFVKHQPFLA